MIYKITCRNAEKYVTARTNKTCWGAEKRGMERRRRLCIVDSFTRISQKQLGEGPVWETEAGLH